MYKIYRNVYEKSIVQMIKIICLVGVTFILSYSFVSHEMWLLNKETKF